MLLSCFPLFAPIWEGEGPLHFSDVTPSVSLHLREQKTTRTGRKTKKGGRVPFGGKKRSGRIGKIRLRERGVHRPSDSNICVEIFFQRMLHTHFELLAVLRDETRRESRKEGVKQKNRSKKLKNKQTNKKKTLSHTKSLGLPSISQ